MLQSQQFTPYKRTSLSRHQQTTAFRRNESVLTAKGCPVHHQSVTTKEKQMDAATTTAATSTMSGYVKDDPEVTSQTMGRRRPTIRDIAAGSSSCLTAQQQQHRRQHQPHSSSQAASSSPCWFVDTAFDELEPLSASPWQHPHFLDECRMCGRYLCRDQDIYMYKGDIPFCSEECRDEHIEMDKAMERSTRRRPLIASSRQAVDKSQAGNAAAVVTVGAV